MTTSTEPLRVSFVCQWYAPEPVTQPGWIVDGLRMQGMSVEVLTGVPNYPTGKVLAGYSAWRPRTDQVDGVRVRRAPLFPSHDRSVARRFLTYLSWAFTSTLVGWRGMRSADVVLVYSSPATAALGAMLQRVLGGGTPYVLHLQDLWPDSIFASGFLPGAGGRLARRGLSWLTTRFYRHASHIVVISPGMGSLLESRGVPRRRISLIYNWLPDSVAPAPESGLPRAASSSLRTRLGLDPHDLILMYAGNHGEAQGLDCAILGLAMAVASGRELRPLHLVLIGDGVARADLAHTAGVVAPDRVHVLGPMSRDDLASVMDEADAQLVSLADAPLFEATLPSKVQSILASGRPILACGAGDVAQIVRQAEAGLVCPPADSCAFAEALLSLAELSSEELARLGTNARAFYDQHMAVGIGSERMATVLAEASTHRGNA